MIASLVVDPAHRPDWYLADRPAHIPLPPGPPRELPGERIAWGLCGRERLPLLSLDGGTLHTRWDWASWMDYVVRERYRTHARPLYTRLPFHYHRIPGQLRLAVATLMAGRHGGRRLPRTEFPAFPIEQGLETLHHIHERHHGGGAPAPAAGGDIVLTHDIDTHEGFRWVKEIAAVERDYGFTSIWNVVGHRYPIEYEVLDWLVEHGFEIGLHGYNHDNRMIFLEPSEIRRRLDRCEPLIRRYQITSYRSDSWFRSEALFQVLADYVAYDYSALDSDIVCPGGTGGCLWTRPFRNGRITHVPTTVPFETPLLFHAPPEVLVDFWRPKVAWLRACGGQVVVVTHPEPHFGGNSRMLRAYEQFLALLTSKEVGAR
jgi:peptidoglycan/xylan/chitin deacetylase (PgdA/CDA1 family)